MNSDGRLSQNRKSTSGGSNGLPLNFAMAKGSFLNFEGRDLVDLFGAEGTVMRDGNDVTIAGEVDYFRVYAPNANSVKINGNAVPFVQVGDYVEPTVVTVNRTWEGSIRSAHNVTVSGGATLALQPGSTFTFDPGKSLLVYGSLVADGTETDAITFTSSNPSARWNGISAENCNPSVQSLLNYAHIEHATTAVRIGTHTRLDVTHCVIDDADIGIEFTPSAQQCPTGPPHVDITDNSFTNIGGSGIIVNDYSNLAIEGNNIRGGCSPCAEGRYGIFCNNASTTLLDNRIHGFDAGLVNVGNSSPILQGTFRGGNNVMTDNGQGFTCDQSDAVLGLITVHNPDGGQNSIVNGNQEALLTNGSIVFAVNNWWGKDEDPSYKFDIDESSKIESAPWLDRDPNEGNRPFQRGGTSVAIKEGQVKDEGEGGRYNPGRSEVIEVVRLRSQQPYAEALQALQAIIAQRTLPGWLRRWAVRQVLAVGQQLPDAQLTEYLTGLVRQYPELAHQVKSILPNMFLHERRRVNALAAFNANIVENPNSPLERTALYEKFLDKLHIERNTSDAAQLLAVLSQRYTGSPEAKVAAKQLQNFQTRGAGLSLGKASNATAVSRATPQLPREFALKQNYPNPFNPSTTFTYELPEGVNLSLTLYDVLGRKVAELVNGYREAGYHSATWDASGVASGVYFGRFTATDGNGKVRLSKINKLLLTK